MTQTPPALPPVTPAGARPKRRGLLVIALSAGLVLGAGGAAAYWFTQSASASTEPAHVEERGGLVPFETFLVNLAGDGGQAYLRVTLKLFVVDETQAEHIAGDEVTLSRLRNAILETLAVQSADQLVTAGGKTRLKQTLKDQLSALVKPGEVRDVLYSDFVIQF